MAVTDRQFAVILARHMLLHGNSAPVDDMVVCDAIYRETGGTEDTAHHDQAFLNQLLKIRRKICNESFLPPVPPRALRIVSTIGLRLEDYQSEIGSLARAILRNGMKPQAQGSGRSSEAPSLVFALQDYPPDTFEPNRLYNPEYPWVTADIPYECLDRVNLQHAEWRGQAPGNVCTFFEVEPQHIIALNGLPKAWWAFPDARLARNPWPDDHIGGHKGKPADSDASKLVRAHFNLNSGGHSIDRKGTDSAGGAGGVDSAGGAGGAWRHWKDEDTLALRNCYFTVQEAGFRSAQATGVRNVHAWVYGEPCEVPAAAFAPAATAASALQAAGWRKATYRPVQGARPMFSDAASGAILPDGCDVLLLSLPNTAGVRIGAKVVKKIGPMWYRPCGNSGGRSKRNPMDGVHVWGYPKQRAKVFLSFLDAGSFSRVYKGADKWVYSRTDPRDEGKKLMRQAAAKATIGKKLLPQAELLGKAERGVFPDYNVFRMPLYERIENGRLAKSVTNAKRRKVAGVFAIHIQPALLAHKYTYSLKEGLEFLRRKAKTHKIDKDPVFLEYYDALQALAAVMPANHSWDVEDRNMAWQGDTLILLDPVFYNAELQWRRPSQQPPASFGTAGQQASGKPQKMSVSQAIRHAVQQALGQGQQALGQGQQQQVVEVKPPKPFGRRKPLASQQAVEYAVRQARA